MTVGGCIVDSGNFDWEAHADKFSGLTTPDESYHGIIYTKKFGKAAYITKATAQVMRDLGSIPSPQNSFLLNIGPRHRDCVCRATVRMHRRSPSIYRAVKMWPG